MDKTLVLAVCESNGLCEEKRWWDATLHRFPKTELDDYPRHAAHTPCTRYSGPIAWTEMVLHSKYVSDISSGHDEREFKEVHSVHNTLGFIRIH